MREIFLDDDLNNADWTKQTWDLIDIENVEQLRRRIEAQGITIADFKELPVYKHAIAKGEPAWLKDL